MLWLMQQLGSSFHYNAYAKDDAWYCQSRTTKQDWGFNLVNFILENPAHL